MLSRSLFAASRTAVLRRPLSTATATASDSAPESPVAIPDEGVELAVSPAVEEIAGKIAAVSTRPRDGAPVCIRRGAAGVFGAQPAH